MTIDEIGANGIAHVRLNRPRKYNGLSLQMFQAIESSILTLRNSIEEKSIRAVILSGEGKAFCAGLDVNAVRASGNIRDTIETLLRREDGRRDNLAQSVGYLWRELDVPVFAAVHGVCFGGGIQIALGADMRFSTPKAKFSIMEAKWGIIPDMSGSITLRELVPMSVANKLTWTGEIFDGYAAKEYGLCDEIVEDPVGHAVAFVEALGLKTPNEAKAYKEDLARKRRKRFRPLSRKMATNDDASVLKGSPGGGSLGSFPEVSVVDGTIASVTLNASSGALVRVPDMCSRLAKDTSLRAAIIDFGEAHSPATNDKFDASILSLAASAIRRLPFPVVAILCGGEESDSVATAVDPGHVALSLAADLRYTASSSRLDWVDWPRSDFFVERLGELVGREHAGAMATHVTADILDAENARLLGLVDVVCASPADARVKALSFLTDLKEKNPDAVVAAKDLFVRTWHADEDTALLVESEIQRELMLSYNMMRCAVSNFLPSWVPRPPFRSRMKRDLLSLGC